MQLSFDTHSAARQPLAWMLDTLNGEFTPAALPARARRTVLRQGQILVIERTQSQALFCSEGTLWITHDNDPVDHIVEGGERYDAGPQRMLVHAMSDARVEFLAIKP